MCFGFRSAELMVADVRFCVSLVGVRQFSEPPYICKIHSHFAPRAHQRKFLSCQQLVDNIWRYNLCKNGPDPFAFLLLEKRFISQKTEMAQQERSKRQNHRNPNSLLNEPIMSQPNISSRQRQDAHRCPERPKIPGQGPCYQSENQNHE